MCQACIEHIHAHFASSAASVARIASLLSGIPFSMTAHAKDVFHESVQRDDLARKLRAASSTFTVSQFNLNYLQEHYANESSRVVRLYNGMHLDDFSYRSPVHRPSRIVAVGRFVEKKGFRDLILACHLLRERGVTFECQLVGGGELEADLRSLVTQLDLDEKIELFGAATTKGRQAVDSRRSSHGRALHPWTGRQSRWLANCTLGSHGLGNSLCFDGGDRYPRSSPS